MRKIVLIIEGTLLLFIITLAEEKLPVVFLTSFISDWDGYTHDGFYINSAGEIFSYQFILDDSIPSYSDTIPDILHTKLLEQGVPAGKTVHIDSVNKMYGFLNLVAAGEVSEGHRCLGFGRLRYSMVLWDSLIGKDREIICYQAGDSTICNACPESKAITRWIINSIGSYNWTTTPSCAPSSCSLEGLVAVLPLSISNPVRPTVSDPVKPFYLNGKTADNWSRRITVDRNGKRPIFLNTGEKVRNRQKL